MSFEDSIGDMTDDLLAEAGEACVYLRGSSAYSITLRKSRQQPMTMETGAGQIIEVRPVDFIAKTVDLPYTELLKGDKIKAGGRTYEVQPTTGEKVDRVISDPMTRIHTKLVN